MSELSPGQRKILVPPSPLFLPGSPINTFTIPTHPYLPTYPPLPTYPYLPPTYPYPPLPTYPHVPTYPYLSTPTYIPTYSPCHWAIYYHLYLLLISKGLSITKDTGARLIDRRHLSNGSCTPSTPSPTT